MVTRTRSARKRPLNNQADHGTDHIKHPSQLEGYAGQTITIFFREGKRLRGFTADFMGYNDLEETVHFEGWEPINYCEIGFTHYPGGKWEPEQRLEFTP